MRFATALAASLIMSIAVSAQEKKPENPPPRYNIKADIETYPQGSAKQTLSSIAEALRRTRVDYILAHLTDPIYVDGTVKKFNGDFEALVRQVDEHLSDPKGRREFERFLKDGKVEESGTTAKVTLADVPKRQMTLRKSGERWFLDNENEAPPKSDVAPPK